MKQEKKPVNTGYPFLFSSLKFSGFTAKNRLVALPVHTGFAYPDGHVSPWMVNWYTRMARSGVAMVIVANAAVSSDGIVSKFNLRADHDAFIPGLARLVQAIKQHQAIACLQLNHAGRFAKSDRPLLPSPITSANLAFNVESIKGFMEFFPFEKRFNLTRYFLNQVKTWLYEMSDQDRDRVIDDFSSAALRAFQAGFDMVELHGANGYLLCQYLSGFTNHIKNRYGPDFNARVKFPIAVIQAMKARLPDTFPIGFRLLVKEWVPGGIDLLEAIAFAKLLEKKGLSYLSVSAGTYNSIFSPDIMKKMDKKAYLDSELAAIKKSVNIPVIASGRITTPDLADQMIQTKTADLVGLGRPLRADPRWVEKSLNNKKISVCLNCNHCLKQVVLEQGFYCLCWPKILQKQTMLEHRLLTRSFKILWVISSTQDISIFKSCWSLLDPEKQRERYPSVLILKNVVEDETFNQACKEFISWLRSKIDVLGLIDFPGQSVIRGLDQNLENALVDKIKSSGNGQVFIAGNKEEAWRGRLLYKLRGRVMAWLGSHPNLHQVLVAIDFSDASLLCMKFVQQTLIKRDNFLIRFVHVISRTSGSSVRPERQWEKFKQICSLDKDIPLQLVQSQSGVVQTLTDLIYAENFGTIIMGKRGMSDIKRWLLGSVSSGVSKSLTDQTLYLID